jgi:hypothetical protein
MSQDKMDDLLMIGASFDWVTPLLNMVQGYNKAAVADVSFDEAFIEQIRLEDLGIKSRIEGNFRSFSVVVKGEKSTVLDPSILFRLWGRVKL